MSDHMKASGFEFEARLVYLDADGERKTLAGVAGVTITSAELMEGSIANSRPNSINEALTELCLAAKRTLRGDRNLLFHSERMHGIASHNLRHLADLMDNDPDFKVQRTVEGDRQYVIFEIPNKEKVVR